MRTIFPRNAGIAVREKRTQMDMRQVDLAAAAGVCEKTIVSLEAGLSPGIRLDKLMNVLNALGLQLNVTGFEEGKEPKLFLLPTFGMKCSNGGS